jgi:predicted MPP superfamily phosphohydrolase
MKRLAWLTDIHLNFLSPVQMEKFYSLVQGTKADVILISGDIGEAPRLNWYLRQLEGRLQRPIYFVLGNHDYYMSSIDDVRSAVSRQVAESRWLKWLNTAGIVHLSTDTALIGHDGWADGRCGDYEGSDVMMNDYFVIRDLAGLNKDSRLKALQRLGDETADYFREWLPKALAKYSSVILLTHTPPFRDACWHEGQISDDYWLPHFVCKAAGDALLEIMHQYPDHQLTVLCGHSHGQGEVKIIDNLRVLTGGAEYGRTEVQKIFEIPD